MTQAELDDIVSFEYKPDTYIRKPEEYAEQEELVGFARIDLGLRRYYEMMGRTDYKNNFIRFVDTHQLKPDCIAQQLAGKNTCSDNKHTDTTKTNLAKPNALSPAAVKIRENMYQRDSYVIFTLYAKNRNAKQVTIEFDTDTAGDGRALRIKLSHEDGTILTRTVRLFGKIDVSKCSF